MNDEAVIFFGNRDLGVTILRHLISVGDIPRAVFFHPRVRLSGRIGCGNLQVLWTL